jgi:hypothetical protein
VITNTEMPPESLGAKFCRLDITIHHQHCRVQPV